MRITKRNCRPMSFVMSLAFVIILTRSSSPTADNCESSMSELISKTSSSVMSLSVLRNWLVLIFFGPRLFLMSSNGSFVGLLGPSGVTISPLGPITIVKRLSRGSLQYSRLVSFSKWNECLNWGDSIIELSYSVQKLSSRSKDTRKIFILSDWFGCDSKNAKISPWIPCPNLEIFFAERCQLLKRKNLIVRRWNCNQGSIGKEIPRYKFIETRFQFK